MKRVFLIAPLLLLPALASAEDKPAALSPTAEQALKNLSSEEFGKREQGVKELETCIGQQLKALLAVQDIEAQQRVITLLEFQECLTRWASDVVKLPPDKRGKMLDWGLKPDVMQAVAQSYSSSAEKRLNGIRALAALKDDGASWMLAQLILDPRKEICSAAMDAVRDRKPTDEIVAALWQRSIEAGILAPPVHGKSVPRPPEADLATDTLVQLQAPQVHERLKKLIETLQKEPEKYAPASGVFMPYNPGAVNFFRIVGAYKTPEALAFLTTLMDGQPLFGSEVPRFGVQAYVSNRTTPLLTLILAAGELPGDYGLSMVAGLWYAPFCAASEKGETEAIAKFKKWQADQKPAATKPAK